MLKPSLHLLHHPFYRAWMAGTLSRTALEDYARQYYPHVRAFPGYLKNALALPQRPEARAILQENLADEDGTTHGTPHPELWLRFAEGLGVPRDAVHSAEAREGVRGILRTFEEFSRSSVAEALGSVYAYECQVPEVATSKIEGLRRHFGIGDERTLSFFEVHRIADVAHRESLRRLIDELPAEERAKAARAAERSGEALWEFLSELQREHGVA